jgi:hypothetical protein
MHLDSRQWEAGYITLQSIGYVPGSLTAGLRGRDEISSSEGAKKSAGFWQQEGEAPNRPFARNNPTCALIHKQSKFLTGKGREGKGKEGKGGERWRGF